MTGELSKNFHGVGIGPLSKILAIKIRMFPYGSFIKEDGILEVGRVRMDSKIDKELE